jgi:hypothetical protein
MVVRDHGGSKGWNYMEHTIDRVTFILKRELVNEELIAVVMGCDAGAGETRDGEQGFDIGM